MDQEAVIADIERRAREAGLSIRRVCMQAGVHPTTFSRWKRTPRNPDPVGANLRTIRQLQAALDELAPAERRRTRRVVSA